MSFSEVHNQGMTLKAYLDTPKSHNTEWELHRATRRTRPVAHIYGVELLAKGKTISCIVRLVYARYRPCRRNLTLLRGAHSFLLHSRLIIKSAKQSS